MGGELAWDNASYRSVCIEDILGASEGFRIAGGLYNEIPDDIAAVRNVVRERYGVNLTRAILPWMNRDPIADLRATVRAIWEEPLRLSSSRQHRRDMEELIHVRKLLNWMEAAGYTDNTSKLRHMERKGIYDSAKAYARTLEIRMGIEPNAKPYTDEPPKVASVREPVKARYLETAPLLPLGKLGVKPLDDHLWARIPLHQAWPIAL